MEFSEISAVLGIDVEDVWNITLTVRAREFCEEMADCYEKGSVERNAFEALAYVLQRLAGGVRL